MSKSIIFTEESIVIIIVIFKQGLKITFLKH
jgi:hypothetical protein